MANITLISKTSGNFLAMPFSQSFALQNYYGILKNPKSENHPIVINKSLVLVAWKVTGKPWLSKAFQNKLPILYLTQGENSSANYGSSWKKWSSWCYRKQIDPFGCNWTRTHNHLVHKRTLNHLAKLTK